MGRGRKDDGDLDVASMLRRLEIARAMGAPPPNDHPPAPIMLASPMADYQALWWLAGLIYQARPNYSLKQVQEDTFALAGSIVASWQRGALDRILTSLNEKYGPPGHPKDPPAEGEEGTAEKAPSSPAGEGASEPDKDPAPPVGEAVAAQP